MSDGTMERAAATHHLKRSHLALGVTDIRLNLYRLHACYSASRALASGGRLPFMSAFRSLQDDFEEFEIHRMLILVAVRIRVIDDALRRAGCDISNYPGFEVGSLYEAGHVYALTVREACNKVIHATEVRFRRRRRKTWDSPALIDPVTIYGQRNRKEWRAELSVGGFIGSACELCDLVERSGR